MPAARSSLTAMLEVTHEPALRQRLAATLATLRASRTGDVAVACPTVDHVDKRPR